MGFDFEQLSDEAAHALSQRVGARHVLSVGRMQVIDRARHAVLVSLGGRGYLPEESCEPPYHFAMLIDESRIFFEARERTVRRDEKVIVEYKVSELRISSDLQSRTDEVVDMVKDAITCYATGITKHPLPVGTFFPAPTFF